jgi:SAM-dependent methyltransferase
MINSESARDSRREPYVLGHSKQELDRLRVQARLIDPITRLFFAEAGVAPGMRVLDVGSGAGDTAFLVAELVGPTGWIIGVDRSAAAIAVARQRANERSLRNVAFVEADPSTMTFEQPFDAVVGRYVLMFQTDPIPMLSKLKTLIRPDGIVVFHEVDLNGARSEPPVPLYDRLCSWLADAQSRGGADVRMGIKLHSAFLAAGLAAPTMRLHSVIGGGAIASDLVYVKAGLAMTLIGEMERLGLATADDLGIKSLPARIIKEMTMSQSVIVGRTEIGAWSRV